VKEVVDGEELMVITRQGQVIRMPVRGISLIGRNTQGVRMVQLEEGDQVTDVTRVVGEEGESVAAGDAAEGAPSGNGSTPDDEAEE
jgi:DNA gyrase subunit A